MATTKQTKTDPFAGEFMQPEIVHGHFQRICDTPEGDILSPEGCSEFPGNEEAAEAYGVSPEDVMTEFGWFARLSAAGYLDSTDWTGPFETEEEAMEALVEAYAD